MMNINNIKKYTTNISWLLLEKIIRLLVGFFVNIWMARYLGPADFGILTFAQAIIGVFIAFVTLGLGPIITRDLLLKKYSQDYLFGTSFVMQFISAILLILTIYFYVFFNQCKENTLILIISFSYIFQIMSMLDSYFQAKLLNKYVAISNGFAFLISSLAKIFLIIYNYELIFFAYIAILESFIIASMYLYFYLKFDSIKRWKYNSKIARSLLNDSWPLMPHKISMVIIANIDMLMISKMMDNYSVGIYAMAYKIYLILIFLASILTKVLFPLLVKNTNNMKMQNTKFIKFYRLMGIVSIFIIIIYFFVGQDILKIAFGEQYRKSIVVLNILMISVFFSFINAVCDQWYVINNYTKSFLFRTVVGAFINIVLNYFLIAQYGINGAAYATIITMIYISYFSNFINQKSSKNLHLLNQAFFSIKSKNA